MAGSNECLLAVRFLTHHNTQTNLNIAYKLFYEQRILLKSSVSKHPSAGTESAVVPATHGSGPPSDS